MEKKNKEDNIEKNKEERMKEIIRNLVRLDVRSDVDENSKKTQELVEKLPHEVLELYKNVGGEIYITDKRLTQHEELSDSSHKDMFIVSSEGKSFPLREHFVFAKGGKEPSLIIHAEDYASHLSSVEVYYELGKAIIRDTFPLNQKELGNPKFINAINEVNQQKEGKGVNAKADEDGRDLLFGKELKKNLEHGQLVDLDLISGNLSEFQHVFAKSFALYYEPHYKEALKSYAPALFNYMLELDQMRFKEISDDVKEKNKNVLDFKWYTRKAESWGVQTFKNWKENLTISEKDIITGYTGSKYDPINEYLRKYDGEIIPNIGGDLDKKSKKALEKIENQIKNLDAALQKSKITENLIVYRRVSELQFGKKYEDYNLRQNGIINEEKVMELESNFKGQTFIQHNYMSTSLVQDPHQSYSNDRYPILLEITIPEGVHGAYIADMSEYPGQYEMLINRGYTFKYDKFSIVKPTREEDKGKEYLKVNLSIYLGNLNREK
ncbi:hypothetical protein I6G54_28770 (plasmid) [Bacillus tropicus]|nr:hypothetical protein I6G54_28770 [Bacillus tropicus]